MSGTIDTTANLPRAMQQLVRTYGSIHIVRALRQAVPDPVTRRLLARELMAADGPQAEPAQ